MKKFSIIATLLVLTACSTPSTNTIYKTENIFASAPPEGAEMVSPEAFSSLSQDSGFRWESAAARAARKKKADAQFEADRTQLELLAQTDPDLKRFVGTFAGNAFGGQKTITVNDRNGQPFKVVTMGQRQTYRELLFGREQYLDKGNQLGVYAGVYEGLPPALREGLPTPQALQPQGYEQVMAALKQAEAKLAAQIDGIEAQAERQAGLKRGPIQAQADPYQPPGYPTDPSSEIEAGEGSDRVNSNCGPVSGGVYQKIWWKQKYFTTSIKNQGNRGSCVSFALTSALETLVAIRNTRWVNLSEQYLYNRAKSVWDPDDYGDGTNTADAAKEFDESNYLLPFESQWNYNPSFSRIDHEDDEYYTKSCVDYDERCSNTTHQGKFVCTVQGGQTYCGSVPPNPGSDGYRISSANVLWTNGLFSGDIPVSTVRNLLSTGHPIVVGVQIFGNNFDPNPQGFITNYSDAGDEGGHAMHLVGYISNAKVQQHFPSAPLGAGGGYFVLKNSWRNCWGDGGYAYVPVNWANEFFKSITYFSAGQVSATFTNKPPTVQITAPSSGASFPYAQDTTYSATATDSGGGNLTIRWSSSKDGDLGSGSQITKHFSSPGTRTITAIAEDALGFKSEPATITVTATNPAPSAQILTPLASATIYAGSTQVVFQGEGLDGNGAFAGPMECSSLSWKSNVAGDALGTGCTFTHTFATTGTRTITLTATDEYGAKGSASRTISVVQKPPVGPPIINITSPIDGKYYGSANTNIRLGYTMDDPGAQPGDTYKVVWQIKSGNVTKTITAKTCTTLSFAYPCFNPAEHGFNDNGVKYPEISLSVTDAEGLTTTDKVVISFGVVP